MALVYVIDRAAAARGPSLCIRSPAPVPRRRMIVVVLALDKWIAGVIPELREENGLVSVSDVRDTIRSKHSKDINAEEIKYAMERLGYQPSTAGGEFWTFGRAVPPRRPRGSVARP